MTARIPMSITHDEYMEAIKPLLDLLNVSAFEIVGDIHLIAVDRTTDDALCNIRFNVVTPPADEERQVYPTAVRVSEHPQGDEFAIWTHRIEVGVTNS